MIDFSPIPYIQKISTTQETGSYSLVFRSFPAISGQEA